MKKLTLFLGFFILMLSCKKTKEKIGTNLIVQAMTNGQWVITSFNDNGTNKTADFSAYKFQFHSDYTVDAINNNTVEKTGSWNGNTTNQSITAAFSGATNPLLLINGTWIITDNSWTYVEAKKTEGADIKTLRLDKL